MDKPAADDLICIISLRLVLTREAGFKLISGTDGQEKMQIRA